MSKPLDTMTVGELKAYLEEFPDTAKVVFSYGLGDYWRTVAVGEIKSAEYADAVYSTSTASYRLVTREEEEKEENGDGRFSAEDKVGVLVLGS